MEDESLQYRRQGLIHRAGGVTDMLYHLDPDWIGSKAWALEQVADSLALCREYGRPLHLITIKTNPNWPEIRESLYARQNASD
jgi:hypothetical protein